VSLEWYGFDDDDQPIEDPMPKVSEMIQSKFLRKEDFDEDQVCTIKTVKLEEMQGNSSETRWVLYFNEHHKGMVLNTTTIRVLEAAFGDDSDNWIAKKVMVYVDPSVSFQGRVVGGLRLRTPKKTASRAAPPPADSDFDDSVPF
jgi:hypothetical protein